MRETIVFIDIKGKAPLAIGPLSTVSAENIGWYALQALAVEAEMRIYSKNIDPHCSGCLGLTEEHVCERKNDGSQSTRSHN